MAPQDSSADYAATRANPILPPKWPPRPTLFRETTWGPFPPQEDYRRAYELWRAVNQEIPVPEDVLRQHYQTATETDHEWMHALGFRVYESIMQGILPCLDIPMARPHPGREEEDGGIGHVQLMDEEDSKWWKRTWTFREIFGDENSREENGGYSDDYDGGAGKEGGDDGGESEAEEEASSKRKEAMMKRHNVLQLKEMLGERGLSKTGNKLSLVSKLLEYGDRERSRKEKNEGGEEKKEKERKKRSLGTEKQRRLAQQEQEEKKKKHKGKQEGKKQMQHKAAETRFVNRLPRADLSDWGIGRTGHYILDLSKDGGIDAVDCLTWAILLSGYNPTYWVSRAHLFYVMGFYDLALGDCYRAFRLIETLVDPARRNLQPGLYPRIWEAVTGHLLSMEEQENGLAGQTKQKMRAENGINYFIPTLRKALHHIISKSLFKLHCWEDYKVWDQYLDERLRMPHRDRIAFECRLDRVKEELEKKIRHARDNKELYYFERSMGRVDAGKPFPQCAGDVDRASPAFQKRINEEFLSSWRGDGTSASVAVRLVRNGENSLGVFAIECIKKGEIIYSDEPSARGHLDRNARPKQHPGRGVRDKEQNFEEPTRRCENCRRAVDVGKLLRIESEAAVFQCSCLNDTIKAKKYFCHFDWGEEARNDPSDDDDGSNPSKKRKASSASARQTGRKKRKTRKGEGLGARDKEPLSCLSIARGLFHHQSCGKDWDWLQNGMMPMWHLEDRGRDCMYEHRNIGVRGGRYLTHNNERHGTLLSMILRDVFDMVLLRRKKAEKKDILAHEIEEMLPLWGGEGRGQQWFPFGWAANIMVPFEILLNLGVDIFTDLTFDTWVIQKVLRKLLPNVVPWDHPCRLTGKLDVSRTDVQGIPDPPPGYRKNGEGLLESQAYMESDVKAEIETLYLHTGFAMFNHGCGKARNGEWMWDDQTPNRIIVRAARDIEKGEEVRLSSLGRTPGTKVERRRMFGARGCDCLVCRSDEK